jgi:voltage-gated potassium channel
MSVSKIIFFFRKNRLFSIALFIFLISFTGAFIFYFIEYAKNPTLDNFGQAIWWVLVTITTVGYGDIVPSTDAGRLLGIFVIFTGVALVSMFTATISSIFVAQKLKEERGLKQITIKDHILLCGWNHTAEQILKSIFHKPNPPQIVMINQLPEDQVDNINLMFKGFPIFFVRGDFAQEEILNRANLSKAKTVLIVPDASSGLTSKSDEKTILTAFSVKAIQPKIKVYAHIFDKDNEPYLKKAQVEDYIVSDDLSGSLLGEMVISPGIPQSIQLLIKDGESARLQRHPTPEDLIGKTFREALDFYRQRNELPIAIVKEQKPLSLSHILSEDYSDLDKFIEKKFQDAGRSLKKGEFLDIRLNPSDEVVLDKESSLIVIT